MKLKPCPFCGGKPRKNKNLIPKFYIECCNCLAQTNFVWSDDGTSERAWNRRVHNRPRVNVT